MVDLSVEGWAVSAAELRRSRTTFITFAGTEREVIKSNPLVKILRASHILNLSISEMEPPEKDQSMVIKQLSCTEDIYIRDNFN